MNVGTAVADEILNTVNKGPPQRSVIICIRGKQPVCFFQGGTTVKVNMVDRCRYDDELRLQISSSWVVTHCDVRFYLHHDNGNPYNFKMEDTWGTSQLKNLKRTRPWAFPEVMSFGELSKMYPDFSKEHWQQ